MAEGNHSEHATWAVCLREAAQRLAPVTETPRLDAEILLAHALNLSRAKLLARLREPAAPPAVFEDYLARRLAHEPIAYITGTWEFFSREFAVHPPALVPRPETEHLAEVALEYAAGTGHGMDAANGGRLSTAVKERVSPRILELGTGTGCVAVTLAATLPRASVWATDIRPENLKLAEENASRHCVAIALYQGDWFEALPAGCGPFDLIVSNPPYVEEGEWGTLSPVIRRHEDPGALLAGPDGLAALRTIIHESVLWLAPDGLLALEMGERQWPEVKRVFLQAGFRGAACRNDLAGVPRIAFARRP